MIKIGITGGIGSGKSTIADMLRVQGYTVFDSDKEAKDIVDNNLDVISKIKEHFGVDIYVDGVLDRKGLSKVVFSDKDSLELLNSIVHPPVREHMDNMIKESSDDLFFIESAIMFESGLSTDLDCVINVFAPKNVRIQRTILRDNTTKIKVLDRMNNQMSEQKRVSLSDYVLDTNQSTELVKCELDELIGIIKKM